MQQQQGQDEQHPWQHGANVSINGATVTAAPLWWANAGLATGAINGIPPLWGYGGYGGWGWGGFGPWGWGGYGLGAPINTALPVIVHPNVSVTPNVAPSSS